MSAEELATPAPAPQNRRALSTAREGYISPRNRTSRQFRLQFAPSRAAGSSGSGGADARTRIAKPNWLRAQAGVPCCEKCERVFTRLGASRGRNPQLCCKLLKRQHHRWLGQADIVGWFGIGLAL